MLEKNNDNIKLMVNSKIEENKEQILINQIENNNEIRKSLQNFDFQINDLKCQNKNFSINNNEIFEKFKEISILVNTNEIKSFKIDKNLLEKRVYNLEVLVNNISNNVPTRMFSINKYF